MGKEVCRELSFCTTVSITSGEIHFLGDPIHTRRTSAIVRSGIACVPEGRRVFPEMTIQENLEIGGYVTSQKMPSDLDNRDRPI